ncbi:beta-galactosidase, partial [Barnesiella sp. GGCC_0306]|nr:beta-galactosidase [Barnesiella sp. GGCC_0306]
ASVYPRSMEKLGQGYGYIMYESPLKYEGPIEKIRLWGANDRANMFVDEKPVLTLYDRELLTEYEFESPIQKG